MCTDSEFGAMPDWDVSNVTDMSGGFKLKANSDGDISAWNVSNVTNMFGIFDASGLNTNNYDAILNGWSLQNVISYIFLGAFAINYVSVDMQQSLINDAGYYCDISSINDKNDLDLSIYPNSTSGILNIEGYNNKLIAIVLNLLGKEIIRQNIIQELILTI